MWIVNSAQFTQKNSNHVFCYFVQYTQSGSSQLRKILDRQKRKAENDSDMDSGSPNSNVVFDLEGECSSFLAVHHCNIIFSKQK